ncbi:MAG TPA: hypothetical protein VJV79_13540 [Polyangiaceae bacterium]|nr:hypothetical protein [Polyangiaceae bacterium]
MANFTYFIVSPGYEVNSFVQYPNRAQGNYIKFGDSQTDHDKLGIRQAYLTHNPDIGIFAVMGSVAFHTPGLGTRLKNFIKDDLKIQPVGTSEWFSIQTAAAWKLAQAMLAWDGRTVDQNNVRALLQTISGALSVDLQTPLPDFQSTEGLDSVTALGGGTALTS